MLGRYLYFEDLSILETNQLTKKYLYSFSRVVGECRGQRSDIRYKTHFDIMINTATVLHTRNVFLK